jgi:HD-GYP domain-containing protein (c-di-GMP phosphodiesterase class II)
MCSWVMASRPLSQASNLEAGIIARGIAGIHDLTDEQIEHIVLFAPLHDIGKIGIPDSILLKPGRLDPEERAVMETHVNKGRDIIQKIIGDFNVQHLSDSSIMLNLVACHHEFLDGSGYPNGLKGDEVPIEARIITVADIFDALTSRRPYKKAWPLDEAKAELLGMADAGKLDRDCIHALFADESLLIDIIEKLPDEVQA